MIELHHCADARSLRPLWALEELGLPYGLRFWPFPPRALAREYLDLNPLGTVPLLVDGDVRMTESAASCHYLATRDGPSPLAVAPGEPGYAAFLNWLHHGEATLTFPLALVLRYGRFEPPERRLPQAVADYERWFLARLRLAEAALAEREWLCAERFTVADVSVGYALHLATIAGLEARLPGACSAYLGRLRARDGFRRALRAQAEAAAAAGLPATIPG